MRGPTRKGQEEVPAKEIGQLERRSKTRTETLHQKYEETSDKEERVNMSNAVEGSLVK